MLVSPSELLVAFVAVKSLSHILTVAEAAPPWSLRPVKSTDVNASFPVTVKVETSSPVEWRVVKPKLSVTTKLADVFAVAEPLFSMFVVWLKSATARLLDPVREILPILALELIVKVVKSVALEIVKSVMFALISNVSRFASSM